jgi:hypothetical protein
MQIVVQTMPSSGVPRRLLGQCLRELRLEASLPVKTAAAALEWSEPKLWRIETGLTAVRTLDVQAMCDLYGAPGQAQTLAALAGQARQATAEGWWHVPGRSLPGGFDVYARLEDQACALLGYESSQVPALLQTRSYARALITGTHPGAGTEGADRLVDECLARQVLVTRAAAPLPVTLIISEALTRCPVGGPQVLAGQLRHLAELATLPNLRLRLVRLRVGPRPGLRTGPFTLLRFPPSRGGRETQSATVCVPGLTGQLYLDNPADVQRYEAAHEAVASCSLDEPATREFLLATARDIDQ